MRDGRIFFSAFSASFDGVNASLKCPEISSTVINWSTLPSTEKPSVPSPKRSTASPSESASCAAFDKTSAAYKRVSSERTIPPFFARNKLPRGSHILPDFPDAFSNFVSVLVLQVRRINRDKNLPFRALKFIFHGNFSVIFFIFQGGFLPHSTTLHSAKTGLSGVPLFAPAASLTPFSPVAAPRPCNPCRKIFSPLFFKTVF